MTKEELFELLEDLSDGAPDTKDEAIEVLLDYLDDPNIEKAYPW